MEDFYGKKFRKIEKKIFAIFFLNFLHARKIFGFRFFFFLSEIFFARSAVGSQTGGEAPSKASEASLAPQASHQPPKAASVRVFLLNWNCFVMNGCWRGTAALCATRDRALSCRAMTHHKKSLYSVNTKYQCIYLLNGEIPKCMLFGRW